MYFNILSYRARVAELVYAYVSEAYGASLESSSLSFRILIQAAAVISPAGLDLLDILLE